MPELKPTMAFAVVNRLGSEFDGVTVCAETDHESARLRFPLSIEDGKAEVVPCLILPAPRPIEQCPEEWKDGRNVLVYIDDPGFSNGWVEGWWCSGWRCFMGGVHPTHIMLPPPAPQEAQDAR